jgi:hypothetical protein
LTGGQLYALPMVIIGAAGIAYCATRPGSRTEMGFAPARPSSG